MKALIWSLSILLLGSPLMAQEAPTTSNGLGMGMGNIEQLSHAKTPG